MKCIATIFPLFFSFLMLAQGRPALYNLSLTDSTKKILYTGTDNLMQLYGVRKKKGIKLMVTGSYSKLKLIEPGLFIIRVSRQEPCTIKIYKKKKLLVNNIYVVDSAGKTLAGLNGHANESVSRSDIVAKPVLTGFIPGSFLAVPTIIYFFTLIAVDGKDTVSLRAAGNSLTEDQAGLIRRLPAGSLLRFEDIVATGTAKPELIKLPSFWIRIRE